MFFLGYLNKAVILSESVAYIKTIIDIFINRLSKNPDIENLREKTTIYIDELESNNLLNSAPYLTGSEHLNEEWIKKFWESLNNSFSEMITKYKGSVSEFLSIYNGEKETSKHLPLKNSLIEYGENNEKLLSLLSTVNKASARSKFISEVVSTGEIFHPLGLSTEEAYTFLKEIPIYEESGILCRIPKWWKNKYESLRMSVSVAN